MNKRNVVIIVQARMGSNRLPNKSLLSLKGSPIIEWVVRRCLKSKRVDNLVVAIPTEYPNEVLENYLKSLKVKVYTGSEKNVLKRFYEAALWMQASHIVRVCADNPLICGTEIDHLIKFYFENKYDYVYNHIPRNNTYPDGLGAEIISFEVLKEIFKNVTSDYNKEHCFSYIWDNPDKFKIGTFNPPDKMLTEPDIKLDIDTIEDFVNISKKPISLNISARKIVELFKK